MTDPTHQTSKPADHGPIPRTPNEPRVPDQPEVPIRTLCEDDADALDALLAARYSGAECGPMPAGLGERTQKLTELLGLLERDTPAAPPADLTVRTMQAVRHEQQRKRFANQVQMLAEPRRTLGFEWRQLAAAVAVFVIAASLFVPVMQRQQADSRQVAGAGRLGYAGRAMAQYATDNLGQMPRGDVRPGDLWWEVGQPGDVNSRNVRSNSAHYFRLYNQGYTDLVNLTCPENEHATKFPLTRADTDWASPESVSFSYQNQYVPQLLRLRDNPTMAVLADRNPLFEVQDGRVVYSPETDFLSPSRAHGGRGQNVLIGNGAVNWQVRPTLEAWHADGPDNIWTAEGIDFYTGRETPAEPGDSMLVP